MCQPAPGIAATLNQFSLRPVGFPVLTSIAVILGVALGTWGAVLVARVIANRLEHGLTWWRGRGQRTATQTGPPQCPPALRPPRKRHLAWAFLGFWAIALGALGVRIGVEALILPRASTTRNDAPFESIVASVAAAMLSLAAGLFVVGLRFDPSRGRRRCPKCWYDMSATSSLRCSECGHETGHERALYRSRRSKATIAFACVPLLACVFLPLAPNVKRYGPIGLVPTTLMIAFWEYLPGELVDASARAGTERGDLFGRLYRGEVWGWQQAWLRRRVARVIEHSRSAAEVSRATSFIGNTELDTLVARRARDFLPDVNASDPAIARAAASIAPYLGGNAYERRPAIRLEPNEVSTLWQALRSSDEFIRRMAAMTLTTTSADARDEDIALLDAMLHDPSRGSYEVVYLTRLMISHATRQPLADAFITQRLRDPDDKVVCDFVERFADRLIDNPAHDATIQEMIRTGNQRRARSAAYTLSRHGRQIAPLIADRMVRDPAIAPALAGPLGFALSESGDPLEPQRVRQGVGPTLASSLSASASPEDREQIVLLLERAIEAYPHLLPELERTLADPDSTLTARDAARRMINTLRALEPPPSVPGGG